MLAVRREDVVVVAQRPAGADLRGLLAQQRGPQAQLALALQRGGLTVETAGHHHVAVQVAQLVRAQVDVVVRVLDALAFRRQQLDEGGSEFLPCGFFAFAREALRLTPVLPVLAPLLRRGLRAAVPSTVTCVLLRLSGPRGPPGDWGPPWLL